MTATSIPPDVTAAPPPTGPGVAALTIVPLRHPGRWVASAVLVAMFVHGLVTNPQWDWSVFAEYFTAPSILRAVRTTLWLTLCGTVLGFGVGTVLAAIRLSRSPLLQVVSWTYVWIFRSVPLIVNVLFWYNIAYLDKQLDIGIPFGPSFLTFDTLDLLGPMTAAVFGLAVHQAAYSAEVMRSGLLSVDHGQREAAAALGIPRGRQFRRIVLPQAMRTILPTGANEVIELTQPGPFRPRTIELGGYVGIKDDDGTLLAMAGERLQTPGFTEVSAVCTHPTVRGRGYAAALSHRVASGILARGQTPLLHVARTNVNAKRVYERLGFEVRRELPFVALTTPS